MLDPRFYAVLSTPTVAELGDLLGVSTTGGDLDLRLTSFASFSDAKPGDLTFLAENNRTRIDNCRATACLIAADFIGTPPQTTSILKCPDPRGAFSRAASHLAQRHELQPGVVSIDPAASISASAQIEPGAIVGSEATIGDATRIGAGAVIGPGVQIGRNCRVGANAIVYCSLIGDHVTILPGAVLGENGFGLPNDADALIAHFGRVIIQDRVSIGANSCIDRGMLGDTLIGENTHIDNLCHIGHNVSVGAKSVMAAFAGVSGSSIVGDGVMFGGRVGLADHVTVGEGARIAAGAAVLEDVPAGQTWAGYPAKPIRGWMRELAWLRRAAQKRPRRDT